MLETPGSDTVDAKAAAIAASTAVPPAASTLAPASAVKAEPQLIAPRDTWPGYWLAAIADADPRGNPRRADFVAPDVATTELTDINFSEQTAGKTVVIDFWAEWCGPCRSFAPVFTKVSGDYADVVFGKVDVDANPALAQAFGVTAIPTLVVLRDNKVLLSEAGAMNEGALRTRIDKALQGPKRMTFQF